MIQRVLTAQKEKKHTLFTSFIFILYLFIATECTVTSALLPDILRHYALNMSAVGFLTAVQSAGQLAAALIGIIFSERFDKIKASITILFLFSASVIGISCMPGYSVLLILFFIRGAGLSLSTIFFNALISDMYPDRRSVYLNFLHIFYGIGSSLGPMIPAFLLERNFSWNYVYTLIGGACLAASALYSVTSSGIHNCQPPSNSSVSQKSSSGKAARIPLNGQLMLLGVIMFCYNGHQVALNNWFTTYLTQVFSASGTISSLALTGYWTAVLAGRFVYSVLFSKYDERKYILVTCLAAGVFMLAGTYSDHMALIIAAVILGGVITGSVYPLLFSLSCDLFPSMSAYVNSLTSACGQMGGLIFTWLLGIMAEYVSFVAAMRIIITALLCIPLFMWILLRMHKPLSSN